MDKKLKILIIVSLLICSLFSFLFPVFNSNVVYASVISDATIYSNVIDDLKNDDDFNASDFGVDKTDYSLEVIQIAESSDKELFVYVYQPCSPNKELNATTINISTGINENLSYINYDLILINSSGCLYKYKVEDLIVSDVETRYYDISSIFRKWNEAYDENTDNDNTINEVSFAVAQKFTAKTLSDGSVEYWNNGVDVVYITDKWCGFVRYSGGFELLGWADACDSHFVAFNTDRQIDKLLEADVYYVQQMWFYGLMGYPTYQYINTLSPGEDKIAYLDYTQEGVFEGSGWFAKKYTWDRISTAEDFIANENRENIYNCGVVNVAVEEKISDAGLEELSNKQWVLRFTETEYKIDGGTDFNLTTQHIVSNVSILRLKFETDGVVYNLGVIDNKQSADLIPDNEKNISVELTDWFKLFLGILMIILIVIVLAPFLPTLISLIITIIKFIFKVIVWVISLPFKLIDFVFKKRE